jgi:hypothetical protein
VSAPILNNEVAFCTIANALCFFADSIAASCSIFSFLVAKSFSMASFAVASSPAAVNAASFSLSSFDCLRCVSCSSRVMLASMNEPTTSAICRSVFEIWLIISAASCALICRFRKLAACSISTLLSANNCINLNF